MAEADAKGQDQEARGLVGSTVGGRFNVTDLIARGGMACVYFASQQPLNRPVAIKVMRANGGPEAEESFRRRFLQEASMLSQLQHPNIVTLLDYGQITDLPGEHYFMAMEFLRGENLAKRFRSRGRMTVTETLRLARQIGRGLREAHRRGFVHRDLKPSNIMIVPEDDQNDIVKLIDFGIGKVLTRLEPEVAAVPGEDITRVGLLLGSPRHMAPEQIRGEAIEPRTDLYGLGVVLFQALSGRLPFDGRNEVDILVAHCSTPAPKLNEACPEYFIPESLSNLIHSLLGKQASSRPTIDEFLRQLAGIEEEVFGALGIAGPTSSVAPPAGQASPAPGDRVSADVHTIPDNPPSVELAALVSSMERAGDLGSSVTLQTGTRRRKKRAVVLFALLGVAGAAGLFVWWQKRGLPALTNVQSLAATAGIVVSPSRAPLPTTFVLHLDSTPSGAIVTEDGIVIGATPLTLFVDHSAVTKASRNFLIEREGYLDYPIEQPDSLEDVAIHVNLVAKPAAPGVSHASNPHLPGGRRDVAKARVATTAYAITGDPLEIRTRR